VTFRNTNDPSKISHGYISFEHVAPAERKKHTNSPTQLQLELDDSDASWLAACCCVPGLAECCLRWLSATTPRISGIGGVYGYEPISMERNMMRG